MQTLPDSHPQRNLLLESDGVTLTEDALFGVRSLHEYKETNDFTEFVPTYILRRIYMAACSRDGKEPLSNNSFGALLQHLAFPNATRVRRMYRDGNRRRAVWGLSNVTGPLSAKTVLGRRPGSSPKPDEERIPPEYQAEKEFLEANGFGPGTPEWDRFIQSARQ